MTGHGCPRHAGPPSRGPAWQSAFKTKAALAILAALCLAGLGLTPRAALAADLDVRLRIAWGGGQPRSWQGTLRLSSGTLSDPQPLGFEADAPGSMHLVDTGVVQVFPRTPRSYDGVDLRVQAPADATLIVELAAADSQPLDPIELPLAKVVKGLQQFDLDDRQNRLFAQRSPGDSLRVTLPRDSLVFATGEKLVLDVLPGGPELAPSTTYLLAVTLTPGRGDEEISTEDREFKTDSEGRAAAISLAVPLPQAEGVYDLKLALFPKRLTTPLVRGKPIVQRKVQAIAIAPVRPIDRSPATWQQVYELDPANPNWWERMARMPSLRRLPNLAKEQLASGPAKTRERLGRPWIELPPDGWQAYPLSIESPGLPHVLEIEYASDREQTLGISLIEPNAAGQVQPIGVDSGFAVAEPAPGHKPEVKRHRLIFWPRTKTPWVLATNRRGDRPAALGKMVVLAGPLEPPALTLPATGVAGRTFAAYYDRPLIAENFSAAEAVDPTTTRTFDDWLTFYQAGERMVASLRHGGYNAVVLSVLHEGSTLYPSQRLQPTPRYDTGVFFESGQDPVRKDVLELLLRLCDRAGIQVIPAVQFAAPLPELEVLRLAEGDEAVGLSPIGPDGRTWIERHGPLKGMGVHYNPLDDRVRQAMRGVTAELIERYGRHASFGGVCVQWSAESYALLPDQSASLDDVTFARFQAESSAPAPAADVATLAGRAAFVQGAGSQAWLAWRTERMTALYGEMRDDLAEARSGAKLYLSPAQLLSGRQVQEELRPRLPPAAADAEVFRMRGLDIEQLARQAGMVVPRPHRLALGAAADKQHLLHHWNQSAGLDALFAGSGPTGIAAAAIHFHEPAQLILPDFDKVSPFGAAKTHTWLFAQITPAGAANRQRLVHSVARLDSPLLIDGGWLMPLGQEEALLPLVKVFRRLPAERFATAQPKGDSVGRGIVVRTLARGGKTYFYLVNDTPWPANVEIDFAGGQALRLTSYADARPTRMDDDPAGLTWTIALEPYDLAGGEIDSAKASVSDYRATFAGDPAESLREQIRDVRLRANALRSPQPMQVLVNPSFDNPPAENPIPGWVHAQGAGIEVDTGPLDATPEHEPARSLRLVSRASDGLAAPVVWVRSDPFEPPATGRLTVQASIRIADPKRQPQLRLAIEGKRDGQVYYVHARLGTADDGRPAPVRLDSQWIVCRIEVPELPLTGMSEMRVGIDLMGEGEVWVDDVQVFDRWFQEPERDELLKSIVTAQVQLSGGQLPDCQRFVAGYWPSFLRAHVPLPEPRPAAVAAPAKPAPQPATTSAAPSTWDKIRNWWR